MIGSFLADLGHLSLSDIEQTQFLQINERPLKQIRSRLFCILIVYVTFLYTMMIVQIFYITISPLPLQTSRSMRLGVFVEIYFRNNITRNRIMCRSHNFGNGSLNPVFRLLLKKYSLK